MSCDTDWWISPLSCEFVPSRWWHVFDAALCDKACQWFATGRWFSPGTFVLVLFFSYLVMCQTSGVTMSLTNNLRKVPGISVCLLFFFMITRHCLTIMNPPDIVYELWHTLQFGFYCQSSFREEAFWNIFPIGSNVKLSPVVAAILNFISEQKTYNYVRWVHDC
jgi:hypothetical protein